MYRKYDTYIVLGIHVTNTHSAAWRILTDDYLNELI